MKILYSCCRKNDFPQINLSLLVKKKIYNTNAINYNCNEIQQIGFIELGPSYKKTKVPCWHFCNLLKKVKLL